MDNFLEGKRAVVTGGTRGIGRAIAEALLDHKASVAICGRDRDSLDSAVAELTTKHSGRVFGSVADVANPEDVAHFFSFMDAKLKGVDYLINNAGVGKFKSTADLSIAEWRQVIDTNLSGVFYCCKEALARVRGNPDAYIINISSLAGKNPFAAGAAYNASKFGLNGFSEAMMLDHRQEGVRVSYIMPGSVNTGFASQSADKNWAIDPSDIADIVLMLLRMPRRTLVSRVEVRPAKPGK